MSSTGSEFGYRIISDNSGSRTFTVQSYIDGSRISFNDVRNNSIDMLRAMIDNSAPANDILAAIQNIRDYHKNRAAEMMAGFSQVERLADGSIRLGEITIPADQVASLSQQNTMGLNMFLTRLTANPSAIARDGLFRWIASNHDMLITSDGLLLGYRGHKADGFSVHAGYGEVTPMVDGDLGTTEYFSNSNLPNHPGNVLSMPREMVNQNPEDGCSFGLHIGTWEYASRWTHSPDVLTLNAFDPADVVVVPSEDSNKMRVCRYMVLSYVKNPLSVDAANTIVSHSDMWDDSLTTSE